jgi:hypothetical protein
MKNDMPSVDDMNRLSYWHDCCKNESVSMGRGVASVKDEVNDI